MPNAPQTDLDHLRDSLTELYAPQTNAEHLALERLALAQFSLLRAARLECDASDEELDRAQRIHVRAERLYRYALADLERILAIRYVSQRPAAADSFEALLTDIMGAGAGSSPRRAAAPKSPPPPPTGPTPVQPMAAHRPNAAAMHART